MLFEQVQSSISYIAPVAPRHLDSTLARGNITYRRRRATVRIDPARGSHSIEVAQPRWARCRLVSCCSSPRLGWSRGAVCQAPREEDIRSILSRSGPTSLRSIEVRSRSCEVEPRRRPWTSTRCGVSLVLKWDLVPAVVDRKTAMGGTGNPVWVMRSLFEGCVSGRCQLPERGLMSSTLGRNCLLAWDSIPNMRLRSATSAFQTCYKHHIYRQTLSNFPSHSSLSICSVSIGVRKR